MAHRRPEPRRAPGGHRLLAVSMTSVALVGTALLITGVAGAAQTNVIAGIPTATPGPYRMASHLADGATAGHQAPPRYGPTEPRTTSPAAPPPQEAKNQPPQPQGTQLPNTIRLPRGGTAYLVHTEVGPDGALPVPSGVNQAAWWGTAVNGPTGATVFAGHVNWAGATGPFAELWHDNVGDLISVHDANGTALRFRITQVLTLNKDQLPQQAPTLFSASGPHRIVLATCGGEWVGGQLGYADNRVVIATPTS